MATRPAPWSDTLAQYGTPAQQAEQERKQRTALDRLRVLAANKQRRDEGRKTNEDFYTGFNVPVTSAFDVSGTQPRGLNEYYATQREDAELANLESMFGGSGPIRTGTIYKQSGGREQDMPLGSLNPLEAQSQKNMAISRAASAASDEAQIAKAQQKAYNDARQAQLLGELRADYDAQQLGQAFALPEEPSVTTRTPGAPGQAETVRVERDPAAGPLSDRERQYRQAPPNLRPALLKQWADMDAKAQQGEAAMIKARADETTAQAALKKAGAPDKASYEWANVGGENKLLTPDEIRAQGGVKPMTAMEALDERKYKKAEPVLRGIGELSEKINTQQGLLAKMSGGASKLAAKANYDDDVAEYTALVSGFTPMVARALGHTGVLTQQDVDSVKALFPLPGDSKTLRDRKISRVKGIIGELEGATSSPAGSRGVATPVGGTVTLLAPDGTEREVSAADAEHYIRLGAKRKGG